MPKPASDAPIAQPLLSALPWPALLLDEVGRVIWLNAEMERQGYAASQGRALQDLLPDHARVLQMGPPWQAQEKLVTRKVDGRMVSERLWLRPVPSGALLVMTDETRLQQLESEHVQTVRLASLGFLLAGVCHEISNPLTAISSMLQLLKSQPVHDIGMFRKGLESISDNVNRILEISRKLTGFSRADSVLKRACPMDRIIEEAVALVRHERSFGNVTIEHHKDAEALVWCNPSEIQQVFFNILANAIQAMEGTGHILITNRRVLGQRVEIMFQDDGPGIRAEHLDKLLEPFFSTKPTGQGTGLGLTICSELVREHSGALRLESTFGKGARVYVDFPLWHRTQ